MDFDRIRTLLPPRLAQTPGIDQRWNRYRAEGGMPEADAFEDWLHAHEPALFASATALHEPPVETSGVLPPRFQDSPPTLIAPQTAAAPRPARNNFHYELLGAAGEGGMGVVHIARDTELLRRVALKQLRRESAAATGLEARFMREVQITAQLDHPNIVPVYALELAPDGTPAYTMKYVQGKTFQSLLDETRSACELGMVPDEAHALPVRLEHFLKVCDAIAYAHDKGVIHRDLKPANLMLGRHNEVYVMDWGLCRVLRQVEVLSADASLLRASADISGGASDTQHGAIVGTPKYMSPEQAQGRHQDLDPRSDQYALGLILYELVTLKSPYDGRNAYEVLVNAAAGKVRPVAPAYKRQPIPRELRAIIGQATALSPDRRYAGVAALAADLRRYLRGEGVEAAPDTFWQHLQRSVAWHRQAALAGILALIAIGACVTGFLLWKNQQLFREERLREQRLLQLRDAIGNVGNRVQTRFLQIEGAVENLASSETQALDLGQASDARFYTTADFSSPSSAPSDLVPNPARFGGRISVHWPVWTLPPDLALEQALPRIRKLVPLQNFHREIYHRVAQMMRGESADMYGGEVDVGDATDNPVIAILLGLADGIGSRYPGWDGLPPGYDPRVRPWYRLAADKHGPQWGVPFPGSISHEVELPLSVPLYNQERRFAGVVSILLSPEEMVQSVLRIKEMHGVRRVYMVDATGNVFARYPMPSGGEDSQADALDVRIPRLLMQMKTTSTGVVEATLGGVPSVAVYDDVAPFGWYVIAIADRQTLFAGVNAARPQ